MTPMAAQEGINNNDDDGSSCIPIAEPLNSSPMTAYEPQQQQIIDIIKNSPKFTIAPARLSSSLGISIEDASAELCGLLRAVGPTASFRFELMNSAGLVIGNNEVGDSLTFSSAGGGGQVMTMVFQFPPDFEQKAYSAERNESIKQVLWNIAYISWKLFKVFIAFGLILSLVILILGGLCAIVAAIVVMARGGGGGGGHGHRQHHQRLVSQMRSMLLTLRQLLWFYVIFGDGLDQMQDPFMRETAHTVVLGLNLLLGSPRSIWFWWNAQRLRDRQQRRGLGRGCGGLGVCSGNGRGIRNGCLSAWNGRRGGVQESTFWRDSWRQGTEVEIGEPSSSASSEGSQRGIVSIAVEFLFGPTPFWPRPTMLQRWKLREKYIVTRSTESAGQGVHLIHFLPFTDDPPRIKIQDDDDEMMKVLTLSWEARLKCLHIVSHFNGVPIGSKSGNQFVFPELMAEAVSTTTIPLRYQICDKDEDDASWRSFFHVSEKDGSLEKMSGYYPKQQIDRMKTMDDVPEYMHECRHVLTKLSGRQFSQCLFLNILNCIGIVMLRMSISKGGALEIQSGALLSVLNTLLSVLDWYARLFFAVPLARGLILVLLNYRICKRNQRRKMFAQWIKSRQELTRESTRTEPS